MKKFIIITLLLCTLLTSLPACSTTPSTEPLPWRLVDVTKVDDGKYVVQKIYYNTETQIFCVVTFNYDTNHNVYTDKGIYMESTTIKFYDINGKEVTQ